MFDGRHTSFAFGDNCAAVCGNYIFCKSVNHRLALKIDTLELVAVIFRRRKETGCDLKPCMQTFAGECELTFQRNLIHIFF